MKSLIVLLSVFLTTNFAAAENGEGPRIFLKSCKSKDSFVNGRSLEIQIKENEEKKLIADLTAIYKDSFFSAPIKSSVTRELKVSEHKVREGLGPYITTYENGALKAIPSFEHLNEAEELILQAFNLTEQRGAKISINLRKIRSATVYELEPDTKRDGPGAYIVEAKNEAGESLGSFVGGAFFGSCN